MFSDWQVWRRTLLQFVILAAVVGVLALAGQQFAPTLLRLVTRTPEPLLAAAAALDVVPQRALLTGWANAPATGDLAPNDVTTIPPRRLNDLAAAAMRVLAGPELANGARLVPSDEPLTAEYLLSVAGYLYRTCARLIGEGEEAGVYLVCSVEIAQPTELAPHRKRISDALHTLGRDAERPEPIYVTVFGRIDQVLDETGRQQAGRKVLARLRGRQVHELGGGELYSMLSYSRLAGPAVPVGGQQVNVSVVLRPDPAADCTWVVIGTPLCTGDY